jgi:hypothetical protein
MRFCVQILFILVQFLPDPATLGHCRLPWATVDYPGPVRPTVAPVVFWAAVPGALVLIL